MRIKPVEEHEARGRLKELSAEARKMLGGISNFTKMWSPSPRSLELVVAADNILFSETSLPREIEEMIAVLVSGLNKCDYCVTAHSFQLKSRSAISRYPEDSASQP